jgi:hypothetical protein
MVHTKIICVVLFPSSHTTVKFKMYCAFLLLHCTDVISDKCLVLPADIKGILKIHIKYDSLIL